MKTIRLIAALAFLSLPSCITSTGNLIRDNVDFGVGVYSAPDGWTYGPARVRARPDADEREPPYEKPLNEK